MNAIADGIAICHLQLVSRINLDLQRESLFWRRFDAKRFTAVIVPTCRLSREPARERIRIVLKFNFSTLFCRLVDGDDATLLQFGCDGWEAGHWVVYPCSSYLVLHEIFATRKSKAPHAEYN